MKTSFKLDSKGFVETDSNESHVTIFRNLTENDEMLLLDEYNLPHDVFYFDQIKPIAPRFEKIQNKKLGTTRIFILSNIAPSTFNSNAEHRLESHVFIFGEQHLYWFINDGHSELDTQLKKTFGEEITRLPSLIMYASLLSSTHFTEELSYLKQQIDYLNTQAGHRTSNEILTQVTDTERNLVILEHTISAQESAIRNLLQDDAYIELLNNDMLVHDVKWYSSQVKKLVHVYRDLFDAVSSLYSDIVANNLNRLMKFLSSLSLVLASSSLIAEFWGMNTGGLPFANGKYGTLVMILIAFVIGLLMYLYLKRRHFFDD